MNPNRRRLIALPLLLALGKMLHAQPAGSADPALDAEANPMWLQVRDSLFAGRAIHTPADDVLQLEAPARAEDAAIVPIAVRTRLAQTDARYIRSIYLIIDNNPSPLGAIFHFTPASGRADIETRVRIDAYTHVRAVAETSDGRLYMSTRFVKASGGCSAPPGKDAQAALATLGRMRLRIDGEPAAGRPVLAQLMVSHPNHSGLAMDQLTRHYTPAHYVRTVRVSYAGEPVMSAEVDFSISENPNFRFYFQPAGQGELKAEVVDSNALRFETALLVQPSKSTN
ncbi:quinoprotein dehydrogenase-associated SoxYZ-like carrier [Thauera sinica]|uniref:Quinoprotein dehydrogenase-associated SoxYZ-like carrier n=1 Tax=Thauera sinica TaxID=2665146 RepID=A0ABW1ALV4_9RHOO|nr:quinoprotein dehydrogenase-associated SoxYZ-like carrier [Thauera sp. K11]ATE60791.1 quinoprotein dehydrogenase-associated SoxYZ-like carrier [Thauera sp. K11]